MRTLLRGGLLLIAGLAGCADSASPEALREREAQSSRPTASAATQQDSRAPRRRANSVEDRRPVESIGRRAAADVEWTSPSVVSSAAAADPTHPVFSGRVYRRSDDRPQHDDAALAESGIHVYESKRLKLYTDIHPESARPLPPVIDAAYAEWVRYFGPLPPNREGTEYQMTGYVMADAELFRQAGLVPLELPKVINGRHWNDRFWMHDQPFDYYRRHLLIHEATHCFMTATRDMQSLSPIWYIEGTAELFGTHRIEADGMLRFRVMPETPEEVADAVRTLGRIEILQTAVEEGRVRSLAETLAIGPGDFANNEGYAWSWALCKLLDTHPRYRERFRRLGEQLTPRAFEAAFQESFGSDMDDLAVEWALFVDGLQHGYDMERAAIDFQSGTPLNAAGSRRQIAIRPDRGWQSSGVRVEAGRTYAVSASGRITVADEPKPWTSEPHGISFRYAGGRPLGQLLGAVRADTDGFAAGLTTMLQIIPIGSHTHLTPAATGTLYLRINDSWSEMADNRGAYDVEVQVLDPAAPPP